MAVSNSESFDALERFLESLKNPETRNQVESTDYSDLGDSIYPAMDLVMNSLGFDSEIGHVGSNYKRQKEQVLNRFIKEYILAHEVHVKQGLDRYISENGRP